MAKARAIVKRRKAVRNIRKITKTMQMIATAKYQKSLKRAVASKPYTRKVRELVRELASAVGDIEHPLLRRPGKDDRTGKVGLLVISSNRGLAGAYNGSVIRAAVLFIRQQEAAGGKIDLYLSGKKGVSFFNFQKRPIVQKFEQSSDQPKFSEIQALADQLIARFTAGELDSVHVAYMNYISAGVQKSEVTTLLPLAGLDEQAGPDPKNAVSATRVAGPVGDTPAHADVYEFSPEPLELLDELLPLTVRTALYQCFLDATTSEHVARMVAMKSATDNADKMVKTLTMQYNRARQSQITTELSEIMGGVEAMKA